MDGALPLGMLMFVGMLVAVIHRRLERRRAARRFPDLARELGLVFSPPRHPGAVGTLSGTFRGRRVLVDPDDQRLISVRFDEAPRVDLRTYEASMRAPHGMLTVHSGDRAFDRFFKTRFACEDIADRIADDPALWERVAPFEGRYRRQVKAVTVIDDGVSCRLDFGHPPHIPVGAIRQLLPACASLAELIEGAGRADAGATE